MTTPVTTTSALSSAAVTVIPLTLFAPTGPNLKGLGDIERQVMNFLSAKLLDPGYRNELFLSQLYADGMNTVTSLGISVPPELDTLRAILGWCGAGVDARSERLSLQGFRMPGKNTVDDDLQLAWQANKLDAESVLVHNDSMIYRASFGVVGVQENRDAPPLTTIESPLNMVASWDSRAREVSAAYQAYIDSDPASQTYAKQLSTLYTRTATIHLVRGDQGWEVLERNDHNLGFVPVIMFGNRPTPSNRYGVSEIRPSWRNTQDRAVRGLVRNEVAAEFFAAMKIWLLGVTKDAFQKPDGSFATAWETFTGRVSTLAADRNGVLPEVFVQQGQDPSGMIKFIDHERQVFSGNAGVPLDYLGHVSDGNPTSADAITKGDFRLMKASERLATQFGNNWEDWARMTLRIWGKPIEGTERLESDWAKFGIPTPHADTVRVATQVNAGMVAADSDDALAEVGWSPVQRARIIAANAKARGLAALDRTLAGLKPPADSSGGQALDGEQPGALNALQLRRDGNPGS